MHLSAESITIPLRSADNLARTGALFYLSNTLFCRPALAASAFLSRCVPLTLAHCNYSCDAEQAERAAKCFYSRRHHSSTRFASTKLAASGASQALSKYTAAALRPQQSQQGGNSIASFKRHSSPSPTHLPNYTLPIIPYMYPAPFALNKYVKFSSMPIFPVAPYLQSIPNANTTSGSRSIIPKAPCPPHFVKVLCFP